MKENREQKKHLQTFFDDGLITNLSSKIPTLIAAAITNIHASTKQ